MMAWCITVTLIAVLILQTSAGYYQVTRDVHPDCNTNVRLQPNNAIQVTRGERHAPCVGYVQYDVGSPGSADYRRMCSTGDTLFTKPNAERVCFTLGLNMWRENTFNGNNDEQIMLYGCDVYTENDVDYPSGTGSVAGLQGTDYNYNADKRCHPTLSSPDSFCYDECHIGGAQAVTSDETEDACTALGGPFYAITCSDKDECNNGVLYGCWGPFPENCKRRDACGPYTKCENQIGSWKCECQYGYEPAQGDPYDPYYVSVGCKDINECLDPDICGYLGQCRNTYGSYICVCIYPELYDHDTYKCKEITCDPVPTIPYAVATSYVATSPVYKDKITYKCNHGYKVVHQMIPTYGYTSPYLYTPTYYNPYYWYNNGHHSDTTFELTCTTGGHWGPYPLPSCVHHKCTVPGYVEHAVRTGDDYDYDKKVTYTCKPGYKPYGDEYHGKNYFTVTCQDDGSWTKGTHCEDINECEYAEHYTCGGKAKYCHNTVGSYRCSCVPYSSGHDGYDTYDCPDTQYPDACHELKRLGLCVNGKCHEKEGIAYCSCYDGYHGSTCEKPWGNAALIIAIIALVLVIIVVIILIMFCCCCNHGTSGAHVVAPHPVVAPLEPIYGRRKPALRSNFFHHHF